MKRTWLPGILWVLFLLGNLALWPIDLIGWGSVSVKSLVFLLAIWLGLFIAYIKKIRRWRLVGLSWLLYVFFRVLDQLSFSFISSQLSELITSISLLLFVTVTWFAILVWYQKIVGQWRIVALSWGLYAVFRLIGQVDSVMSQLSALVTTALVFYAMITGYFSLTILAFRRDVTIAYVFFSAIVIPVLMILRFREDNDLLKFLGISYQLNELTSFSWMEPFFMAALCVEILVILGFIKHIFQLIRRELNSEPLQDYL